MHAPRQASPRPGLSTWHPKGPSTQMYPDVRYLPKTKITIPNLEAVGTLGPWEQWCLEAELLLAAGFFGGGAWEANEIHLMFARGSLSYTGFDLNSANSVLHHAQPADGLPYEFLEVRGFVAGAIAEGS